MPETIRAGMIGCDTSHCVGFTKLLHEDKEVLGDGPPVRVVACYPSFSPDIRSSAERVRKFKNELIDKWNVEMVDSIPALMDVCDVVLLESVDGRRHLKELGPVAEAGKPCYIDKPFAASLGDAKEMVKLIRAHKLPCFSSSSLRFDSVFVKFMADKEARGQVHGCDAYSPAHLEPTNPGLFWYGIHGVEILYTIMGTGCRTVSCSSSDHGDLAVGVWRDGRIGSLRGIRKGKADYGAMVLAEKVFQELRQTGDFYKELTKAIVKFFRTKQPPVPVEETLEICAFIDAANRSAQLGGDDVELGLDVQPTTEPTIIKP